MEKSNSFSIEENKNKVDIDESSVNKEDSNKLQVENSNSISKNKVSNNQSKDYKSPSEKNFTRNNKKKVTKITSEYNCNNGRELVEKISSTALASDCYVIKYGYQQMNLEFYYCYTCDPEGKMPFCPGCLNNCHNFSEATSKHEISDKVELDAICYCGFSNHILSKSNVDREFVTSNTCTLSDWHTVLNIPLFVGKDKKTLCFYCHEVCNSTVTVPGVSSKTFYNNNPNKMSSHKELNNMTIAPKREDMNDNDNNNEGKRNNDVSGDNVSDDNEENLFNQKCYCNSTYHLDRVSLDLIKAKHKISLFHLHKVQKLNLIFNSSIIIKQVYKKLFRKIDKMNNDLVEFSDSPITSIDKDLIDKLQRLSILFCSETFGQIDKEIKLDFNFCLINKVDRDFLRYFKVFKLEESLTLDFIFEALERDFDTKSNYVWSFKHELVIILHKLYIDDFLEENYHFLTCLQGNDENTGKEGNNEDFLANSGKHNFLNKDLTVEDIMNINPLMRVNIFKQNLRFYNNITTMEQTKGKDYSKTIRYRIPHLLQRSKFHKYRGYSVNEMIEKILNLIRYYVNIKTAYQNSRLYIIAHLYTCFSKIVKYGFCNNENADSFFKITDELFFVKLLQEENECKTSGTSFSFNVEVKSLYKYIFRVYSEILLLLTYQYNDEVLLDTICKKEVQSPKGFIMESEFGENLVKSVALSLQVLHIIASSPTIREDDKAQLSKKLTNISSRDIPIFGTLKIKDKDNHGIVFPNIKHSGDFNYTDSLTDEAACEINFKEILNMCFSDSLDQYSHNLFSMIQDNSIDAYYDILVVENLTFPEIQFENFLKIQEKKLEERYFEMFTFKSQNIEKLENYIFLSVNDVLNELKLENYSYKQFPLHYSSSNFRNKNTGTLNKERGNESYEEFNKDNRNVKISDNKNKSKDPTNINIGSSNNQISQRKNIKKMELIRVSRTYLANSHENLLALTYCLDNNNNNDKNIYLSKNLIFSKEESSSKQNSNRGVLDSVEIKNQRNKIILSKANYILSLLKGLKVFNTIHLHKVTKSTSRNIINVSNSNIQNQKNVISISEESFYNINVKDHIIDNILKLLYFFIENSVHNCFIVLSNSFLNGLRCCGIHNLPKVLEFIINVLKTIGTSKSVSSLKSLHVFLSDIIENVSNNNFQIDIYLLIIQVLQQMMSLNICNKTIEMTRIKSHLKRLYTLNLNVFKTFINAFKANEITGKGNYNSQQKNTKMASSNNIANLNMVIPINNANNNVSTSNINPFTGLKDNFLNSNNTESLSPDANGNLNSNNLYRNSFIKRGMRDSSMHQVLPNNNNLNSINPINPDGINPSTIINNNPNASFSLFLEKNLRNLYFADKSFATGICIELAEELFFNFFYLINSIYEKNDLFKLEDSEFISTLPDLNDSILIVRRKGLDLAIRSELLKFIRIFYIDLSINEMRTIDYQSSIANKITFENDYITTCLNNFAQSGARSNFNSSLEFRMTTMGTVLNNYEEYTLITNFYQNLSTIGHNKPGDYETNLLRYELKYCLKIITSVQEDQVDFFLNDYILDSLIPLVIIVTKKIFLIIKFQTGVDFIRFYEIMKMVIKTKLYFLKLIRNHSKTKLFASLVNKLEQEIYSTETDYNFVKEEEFHEFDFCLVDNYLNKHLIFFKDLSFKVKRVKSGPHYNDGNFYFNNIVTSNNLNNNNNTVNNNNNKNHLPQFNNQNNLNDPNISNLLSQVKNLGLYSKKQANFSLLKCFLKKKTEEHEKLYENALETLSSYSTVKGFINNKSVTVINSNDKNSDTFDEEVLESDVKNQNQQLNKINLTIKCPTNSFFLMMYHKYSANKTVNFSETSVFKIFDKKLTKETTYLDFITNYCCNYVESEYNSEVLWITFKLLQSNTIGSQLSFAKIENLNGMLEYLVRLFVKNFVSLLFNRMNDAYLNTLDFDYQLAFNIIKIWKYLCEEHNIYFQEVFFKEIKVNYQKLVEKKLPASVKHLLGLTQQIEGGGNNFMSDRGVENTMTGKKLKKISLFDFLLCCLSKLILICEWKSYYTQIEFNSSVRTKNDNNSNFINPDSATKKPKNNNNYGDNSSCFYNDKAAEDHENNTAVFYYDLIFSICELCIEMIQGTTSSNLNSLIKESESSKIFVNFISEIKSILLSECYYTIDNNTLIEIQKNLFNLVISFIEEKNTPKEIVVLIAQNLSPNEVIQTISVIMNFLYEKLTQADISKVLNNIIDKSGSINQDASRLNNSSFSEDNGPIKYSEILFDSKKEEFFNLKYFSDLEFTNDYPIMEIANKMFQYLVLLSEEHKIDIAEEIISTGKSNPSNQYHYLISFFSNINKLVEVEQENDTYRVIFIVHPLTKYLSFNTKNNFVYNVDRSNRYTKLISLLDSCEFFFEEVQHNYAYSQKNFLFFYMNKVNYFFIEVVCLCIVFAINVILLVKMYHVSEEEVKTERRLDAFSLNAISNATDITYSIANTSLNYFNSIINNREFNRVNSTNIITSRYLEEASNVSNTTDDPYAVLSLGENSVKVSNGILGLAIILITISVLTCFIWLISKFKLNYVIEKKRKMLGKKAEKTEEKRNSLNENIKYYIEEAWFLLYNCAIKRNEINAFLWHIIFASLAISNRPYTFYFFSLELLIVCNISSILKTVINAHVTPYPQLLSIFLLIELFVYLITCIYFFLVDDRDFIGLLTVNGELYMENFCSSLISCFYYLQDYGIRLDTNVGEYPHTRKLNTDPSYYLLRTINRIFFFISVVMVLLSLFFGIVVQSFSDLRVQSSKDEDDRENVCFICGATKDQIQKKGQNYNYHIREVHNLWVYVNYIIGLKFEDPQETNAINSAVIEMLEKRQIGWFPIFNPNKEENSTEEKKNFNLYDAEIKIIDEEDEEKAEEEENK